MALAVSVSASPAEVGTRVAAVLVETIHRARVEGRHAVIGWPVGRTPLPVIDALVAQAPTLDLHDVVFALMDDYVNHPRNAGWQRIDEGLSHSCRGSAVRDLVAPLDAVLPPEHRLRPADLWSPDPVDPAAFDRRLADTGGVDVFVVALGDSDGHVALNPPGTPADSRTRIVRIADSTRRDNLGTFPELHRLEDVPTHGVSVGLATITDARRLAVIAHGSAKRDAVAALLHADHFVPELPMTAVTSHPDVTLFCDRAAVSEPVLSGTPA